MHKSYKIKTESLFSETNTKNYMNLRSNIRQIHISLKLTEFEVKSYNLAMIYLMPGLPNVRERVRVCV